MAHKSRLDADERTIPLARTITCLYIQACVPNHEGGLWRGKGKTVALEAVTEIKVHKHNNRAIAATPIRGHYQPIALTTEQV